MSNQLTNYRITYHNGNTLQIRAYSVRHVSHKYYICGKAFVGDGPEWTILSDTHIRSIIPIKEVKTNG